MFLLSSSAVAESASESGWQKKKMRIPVIVGEAREVLNPMCDKKERSVLRHERGGRERRGWTVETTGAVQKCDKDVAQSKPWLGIFRPIGLGIYAINQPSNESINAWWSLGFNFLLLQTQMQFYLYVYSVYIFFIVYRFFTNKRHVGSAPRCCSAVLCDSRSSVLKPAVRCVAFRWYDSFCFCRPPPRPPPVFICACSDDRRRVLGALQCTTTAAIDIRAYSWYY